MIRLNDIHFAYPGHEATPVFSGLSAAFSMTECSALTGANGSGKTTLAQLILGILRPGHGLVMIGERPVHRLPLWQIGREIGYLMQNPLRQLFAVNVIEELTFPYSLQQQESEQIGDKAQQLLQNFGLWYKRSESPLNLSSGEQKRLALAAMLIHDPAYLILDEPGSGLDQASRSNLIKHLNTRLQNRQGMLLISHDPEFLAQLADRRFDLAGHSIREVAHDV